MKDSSLLQAGFLFIKAYGLHKMFELYNMGVEKLRSTLLTYYLSNIVSMAAISFMSLSVLGMVIGLTAWMQGLEIAPELYNSLLVVSFTVFSIGSLTLFFAYRSLRPQKIEQNPFDFSETISHIERIFSEISQRESSNQSHKQNEIDRRLEAIERSVLILSEAIKLSEDRSPKNNQKSAGAKESVTNIRAHI